MNLFPINSALIIFKDKCAQQFQAARQIYRKCEVSSKPYLKKTLSLFIDILQNIILKIIKEYLK